MATKKNSEWVSALLYIVLGILLVVFKEGMLSIAMTVAGIVFLVSGIVELARKNFVGGAVSLVIGIVILVLGWKLAEIVFLVLGILIAIKGVIALVTVLQRSKKNALQLVFPILTIVLGLLLAFGNLVGTLILIVGILLIIDGIIGFAGALKK